MSESHSDKAPRVLSCLLCQQRKVKCDRTFPCANCVKTKAQCVPAGLLPRRRKRRFAERELLDRLRQYEDLLRRNNIEFKPLHGDPPKEEDDTQSLPSVDPGDRGPSSRRSPSRFRSSDDTYEAKNFWSAVNRASAESAESDEHDNPPAVALTQEHVKKAWDQGYGCTDSLGGPNTPVDLSSLHPEPPRIFRLWQIYLDNVDPLLKVTHTPTLQVRIIEAATNLKGVSPVLEALMFGIYCIATLSLMSDDCEGLLGSPRDELLARYQQSCRQALVQCAFLRSDDRDCLTALYFYLISLRPTIGDPRALSSMLGIAVRIAERMGLHSESACAKHPPLEAEMRRRLWWALVIFDARIGEMADYRTPTLTPLWDCNIPINVNDFDLRPGMKDIPKVQGHSSEALFVVVRSEVGDFLRNSSFHLDFTCPPLKAIAREVHCKPVPGAGELDALENWIEERYLRLCNPENPLHFLTIWMTRGWLAKCRLLEYYSKYSAGRQTKSDRDAAMSYALAMVECDTKMLSNPCMTRYLWFLHWYFPFPAYIHILQDLRRRPLSEHSEKYWISLGENSEARSILLWQMSPRILFRAFSGIVFQAWEATESALRRSGQTSAPPKLVSVMNDLMTQNTANLQAGKVPGAAHPGGPPAPSLTQLNFGLHSSFPAMSGDNVFAGPEMWMPFDLPSQISGDGVFTPSDWTLINWGM
ncbi:hypothetical protein BJX76DRAFT_351107 [Aspergillus varians]